MLQAINTERHEPQITDASSRAAATMAAVSASQSQVIVFIYILLAVILCHLILC